MPPVREEGADDEYCERKQQRKHRPRSCDDSIRPCDSQAGWNFRKAQEAYSATIRAASASGATLAAQYLNSGILPNGSSAGLVSRFAAASTNANGMDTTPSGTSSSCRAASSIVSRRVVTRTMSPGLILSLAIVPRERLATAPR